MDQALDVKEKEMQSTFSEMRVQIESEFKKRARAGNDFTMEKGKIYKMIDDLGKEGRKTHKVMEIIGETVGVIVEGMVI